MKLRYTLLILFLSLTISAQEVMVYYNVSFKTDSLQDNFKREEAVLDLSKDAVKFYSTEYLKADSLQRQTNERQFAYPKLTYRVKRNANTSNNTEYIKISKDYYALPSNDIQDWRILDDTKTVNGIKLRKAMTQYGNRDWEAWFSEDYPISEGPYKFRGLPGLIFELRDTNENYIFSVNRIVNKKDAVDTDGFLETDYGKKAIPINLKMYRKLKLENFENPLKGTKDIIMLDEHGNKKVIDMRAQAKKYQVHLKKHNNPIDLTMAISYPEDNK